MLIMKEINFNSGQVLLEKQMKNSLGWDASEFHSDFLFFGAKSQTVMVKFNEVIEIKRHGLLPN